MKARLDAALESARSSGASYAEARWGQYRYQEIGARGRILEAMQFTCQAGYAVRAFYKGAWGFASGTGQTIDEVAALGREAVRIARASAGIRKAPLILTPTDPVTATWKVPAEIDPFTVPIQEKTELLFDVNQRMSAVESIREALSMMRFVKTQKVFANTDGSYIDQTFFHSGINYTARAVGSGRFVSRSSQIPPLSRGYELIDSRQILGDAERVAKEARMKLAGKTCRAEIADLVLLPSHTRLVIHETIGHATELDRVMGWEADYAGTSFATPEKLNTYRYGSPVFNVIADRTQPHGLATCAYDDEGVPAQSWPIIENGVLTGYATTRDTAPMVGMTTSRGCAFADKWSSVPILRMANVGIQAGPDSAPCLTDLIADTDDGILVDGMGTYSIDHQRINFQFGGDFCRRIHKGHLAEVLYNVTYEGSNPMFWSSVDVICNASEWQPHGISGCAKGQPVQIAALTHGSSPLRIRDACLRRSGA